jgi:hypothetical protein
MTADTVREYSDKLKDLHAGIITEQEWKEYCASILAEVMDENKDVYLRMKERGD